MANESTAREILYGNAANQRCLARRAQTPQRPSGSAANGFLKQQFLPLYLPSSKPLPPRERAEQGIFASLELLAGKHGIQPLDVSGYPYPYNILMAIDHLKGIMNDSCYDFDLAIVSCPQNGIYLQSVEDTRNCNNSYIYVPIAPVYQLMRERKNPEFTALLISMLAFLYYRFQIPFPGKSSYTQVGSIYELYLEDEEFFSDGNKPSEKLRKELSYIAHVLPFMETLITEKDNADTLSRRTKTFAPLGYHEQKALAIAQAFISLHEAFPNHAVYTNIPEFELDDLGCNSEGEYIDLVMGIDYFISFALNDRGFFEDDFVRSLNDCMQGNCHIDQPTAICTYHAGADYSQSIEFDKRLYVLLFDFASLLNALNHG